MGMPERASGTCAGKEPAQCRIVPGADQIGLEPFAHAYEYVEGQVVTSSVWRVQSVFKVRVPAGQCQRPDTGS
jgi:hypothetical protein